MQSSPSSALPPPPRRSPSSASPAASIDLTDGDGDAEMTDHDHSLHEQQKYDRRQAQEAADFRLAQHEAQLQQAMVQRHFEQQQQHMREQLAQQQQLQLHHLHDQVTAAADPRMQQMLMQQQFQQQQEQLHQQQQQQQLQQQQQQQYHHPSGFGSPAARLPPRPAAAAAAVPSSPSKLERQELEQLQSMKARLKESRRAKREVNLKKREAKQTILRQRIAQMTNGLQAGDIATLAASNPALSRMIAQLNASSAAASSSSAVSSFLSGSQAMAALASSAVAATPAAPPREKDDFDADATSFQTDRDSHVVFQQYTCKSIPYGRMHPCDVTEAGTLSSVPLPPAQYPLREALPAALIDDGLLSSLQLEGILYACQRHQQFLHSGERCGFFLADGAGVGKGRQIAGIIYDSLLRNNSTKHVWVSVSTDLYLECKRDLNALGCYANVINGLQSIDERMKDKNWKISNIPSSMRDGVMFSTYATLVSGLNGQRGKRRESRLEQLIQWCGGKNFDGVLVFDECHRAKNFKEMADGSTDENSSLTGQAVVRLQKELPRARVVYASATGVTDIKNMAYFTRLGLWGEGSSFTDFGTFEKSVRKRGIGAFELLSMELKNVGTYVSRGLSYASCTYIYVDAELNDQQETMYNTVAQFWLDLKSAFADAMHMTGTPNTAWKLFWGTHLRFFGQLCSSVKVNAIVQETKKAIDEGYAVVIGLQTTGESSMAHEDPRDANPAPSAKRQRLRSQDGDDDDEEYVDVKRESCAAAAASSSSSSSSYSSGDTRTEFPSIYRESLLRFLREHFPCHPYVKPEPKSGAKKRGRGSGKGQKDSLPTVFENTAAAAAASSSSSSNHRAITINDDDEPVNVFDTSAPSTPNSMDDFGGGENGHAAAPIDPTQPVDAALVLRNTFMDRVRAMKLPTSPLDELIDKLGGPDLVAEMTGRRARYVRNRFGKITLEVRGGGGGGKGGKLASTDDVTSEVNIYQRNQFMEGKKLIAIISDAASTGISLHSDRAVKSVENENQKPRLHITMELPWSADKAIQQLGRTHRSNEVTGVLYALVISSLGGERRFASACAQRLLSLGALTKGDRRAATGSNLAQYDIDTDYGRKALRTMLTHIFAHTTALGEDALNTLQAAGMDVLPADEELERQRQLEEKLSNDPPTSAELETHKTFVPHPQPWHVSNVIMFENCLTSMGCERGDVHKFTVKSFLNRILGLPVVKQNALFEYFMMTLNYSVLLAKQEGTYSEAVSDLTAESIVVEEQSTLTELVQRTDVTAASHIAPDLLAGGAKTLSWKVSMDRGISFESACEILRNAATDQQSEFTSFYIGTHPVTGQTMPLLAIKRPASSSMFQVMRPNSGRATQDMSKSQILRTYHPVKPEQIESTWTSLFELTLKYCTHGPKCKIGESCTHGRRTHTIHILGGHVLSYLSDLSALADRNASQLSVNERQLKCVRVDADDGQRLVGLLVPAFILNIWLHDLTTGALQLSRGLAVPASSEDPRSFSESNARRFTTPPRMLGSQPAFFGGSKTEAGDRSLIGGAAQIAESSTHDALPHESVAHSKPSLHTLVGTREPTTAAASSSSSSSAAAPTAKKQTSISSFFTVKPIAAFPSAAAALSSSSRPAAALSSSNGAKKPRASISAVSPQISPSKAAPSNVGLKRKAPSVASEVIDLLTSSSESESTPPSSRNSSPHRMTAKQRSLLEKSAAAAASSPSSSIPTASASSSTSSAPAFAPHYVPQPFVDGDDFLEDTPITHLVKPALAASTSSPHQSSVYASPHNLNYSPEVEMDEAEDADDEVEEDVPIQQKQRQLQQHEQLEENVMIEETPEPSSSAMADENDMPPLCY